MKVVALTYLAIHGLTGKTYLFIFLLRYEGSSPEHNSGTVEMMRIANKFCYNLCIFSIVHGIIAIVEKNFQIQKKLCLYYLKFLVLGASSALNRQKPALLWLYKQCIYGIRDPSESYIYATR